jgi:integrase
MLTVTACTNAKPKEKPYKLADSGGLYLLVNPTGSKLWRLKYYFLQKERLFSIGAFPSVSLAAARDERDRVKKLADEGIDPAIAKKEKALQTTVAAENTFEAIGREWHSHNKGAWAERYAKDILHRIETDIFPEIGALPITAVKPPQLLAMVRKIEERGAHEIALRAVQMCGQIFRFAIVTGRAESDPSRDLKGALKPYPKNHHPALEAKDLPSFLLKLERNEIRSYPRSIRTTKLLMLTFVRTNELISATKAEFDFKAREWRIPGEKMKMKRDHIVPLSRQAMALFKEQFGDTGDSDCKEQFEASEDSDWLFPNLKSPKKHMSNNTVLDVIHRLGYKGDMTGHGFRALAMSTIKEKLGYRHEVIDRQLAHAPKSGNDAAYDRAAFLDERKKMMQEWADYLDAALVSAQKKGKSVSR